MTSLFRFILLSLLYVVTCEGSVNLIQNPSFEEEGHPWHCTSCDATRVDDPSIDGSKVLEITGRSQVWQRIQTDITSFGPGAYEAKAHMKILGSTATTELAVLTLLTKSPDGTDTYQEIGRKFVRDEYITNWFVLAADLTVDEDVAAAKLIMLVRSSLVDFRVDNVYLGRLPSHPNWLAEAEERIMQHRKGDITLRFTYNHADGETIDTSSENVNFTLVQKRHDFGLGFAIDEDILTTPDHPSRAAYLETASMFNQVVLPNACKWRFTEQDMDDISNLYDRCRSRYETIHNELGIRKVRLHSMAWNKHDKLPSWLLSQGAPEASQSIFERIADVQTAFADSAVTLDEIDVVNEPLNGYTLELLTNNTQIVQDAHRDVQEKFQNARVYLNDYGILSRGQAAFSRLNRVKDGIDGAGINASVTELTVAGVDLDMKTEIIRNLSILLFSEPMFHSMTFWGFSDLDTTMNNYENAALAEGPNVELNQAGLAFRDLFYSTYWTHETHQVVDNIETIKANIFYGDYDLIVRARDQTKKISFSFTRDGPRPSFNIGLTPVRSASISIVE